MPATSLQQLKIPRGYRGDWPLQEYALIDAVEATINEIEVARGSNTSLAAELEETYATKSYVQLAIANPNVNDIYVSDLAVKVSEAGLVGYTLQVQPGKTLAFTNTYTLGNGTLANPAIKFNTSVSGGLFMTQNSSHETMNVKVSGGVALEIVHDKVSGANILELGNFVAYSDGDIEATDITARAITATGTGAYATHLAEAIIGEGTINTLNVSTTVSTTDISFSYFGTILVLDAQNLNTLPNKSLYARTTNTCTNTPEVSAGYLNHYWSGAGQSRQTWVSSTTGYLYERVNNGAWTKYAKAGGDSSITFSVANGVASTDAVNRDQLDSTLTSANSYTDDEILALATATQDALDLKANLNGNTSQKFSIQDGVANTDAASVGQVNTAMSSANGYTDSAITGLESSISGEIVSIVNRLDSAESDIVGLGNPILKVIGYLYAKLISGGNLQLGYNSIISTVSRHAGSGGHILNVTFSYTLDSPYYFVIGGVTGGGGYGGRSFEVLDQTINGFKIQSICGGDNYSGYSDGDGAVFQMLIYQH